MKHQASWIAIVSALLSLPLAAESLQTLAPPTNRTAGLIEALEVRQRQLRVGGVNYQVPISAQLLTESGERLELQSLGVGTLITLELETGPLGKPVVRHLQRMSQ